MISSTQLNIVNGMNDENLKNGVLYIVATPIGNLEDITIRALKILRMADIIAAEDTRHTRKLLSRYKIRSKMMSYHDFNEKKSAERILSLLRAGKHIALVTDGGTPCISDPGFIIVSEARKRSIPVIAIPGPSAIICGLSTAGIPCDQFVFEGFLPVKSSARKKRWELLVLEERSIIFYEAPHRFTQFLSEWDHYFPNRQGVICRELTKIHEEVLSGYPGNLRTQLDSIPPRGEYTVIIEPQVAKTKKIDWNAIESAIKCVASDEKTSKEICEEVANATKIPFRKIYKYYLSQKH